MSNKMSGIYMYFVSFEYFELEKCRLLKKQNAQTHFHTEMLSVSLEGIEALLFCFFFSMKIFLQRLRCCQCFTKN